MTPNPTPSDSELFDMIAMDDAILSARAVLEDHSHRLEVLYETVKDEELAHSAAARNLAYALQVKTEALKAFKNGVGLATAKAQLDDAQAALNATDDALRELKRKRHEQYEAFKTAAVQWDAVQRYVQQEPTL